MKKITLLLILTFGLIRLAVGQKLITVDNTPESNAQYKTITDALAAATANDTIYVHPSANNYTEIYITKPVTLIGYSHSNPTVRTVIDRIFLQDGASNVNINGFKINTTLGTPPSNTNILTNLTIQNCQIMTQLYFDGPGVDNLLVQGNVIDDFGSRTANYNNYTNAVIMNNVFTGPLYVKNHQSTQLKQNMHVGGNGIANMDTANGQLIVQNSIFLGTSIAGTPNYNNNGGIEFQNCLTYWSGDTTAALSGTNNINDINPEFVNGSTSWDPTLDYHLKSISPAIGTGVDGLDMGIFNAGPFTFNNNGYANGIPTVTISSLTQVIATNGQLEVNITTTSY